MYSVSTKYSVLTKTNFVLQNELLEQFIRQKELYGDKMNFVKQNVLLFDKRNFVIQNVYYVRQNEFC